MSYSEQCDKVHHFPGNLQFFQRSCGYITKGIRAGTNWDESSDSATVRNFNRGYMFPGLADQAKN